MRFYRGLLIVCILTFQTIFSVSPSKLRQSMIDNLAIIRYQMEDGYAPQEWKQEHRGWTLQAAYDTAKRKIQNEPHPNLKFFHRVVLNFLNSTKDYHVSVHFASTEKATLPFTVKGVEGHYLITYIDQNKLPSSAFPINEGDELVTIGGKPTDEVVKKLQNEELSGAHDPTDRSLAEIYLTRRVGYLGMEVPKGPIEIEVKKSGSKDEDSAATYQLSWDYDPEAVVDNLYPPEKNGTTAFHWGEAYYGASLLQQWAGAQLELPLAKVLRHIEGKDGDKNPFSLGSKVSMLPKLGRRLWQSDDFKPFVAYLYESPDKHLVGFLRIPSYSASSREAKKFEKLIKFFEESSDALVIDQMNNPGGSVFYLYGLASMLTETALITPKHRMAITQDDVLWAVSLLELVNLIQNDEDAQSLLGDDLQGYPNSYQTAQFIKGFCRFVLDEWKKGKTYTDPTHLFGVDHINPHPTNRYTKPILLLTNELDFSGGDFFPAILQDNHRVTIMGTRTAGAGGYVEASSFRNRLGVDYFCYTGSLALRKDGKTIEDLGVTPDVEYKITKKDLQGDFEDFVKAINNQIDKMLDKPAKDS